MEISPQCFFSLAETGNFNEISDIIILAENQYEKGFLRSSTIIPLKMGLLDVLIT